MHDQCMAVKTITIDMEAYEILARHKKAGQSFSRVIKEHFGKRKTAREFVALLRDLSLAEETQTAIDKQVRSRRSNPARPIKL